MAHPEVIIVGGGLAGCVTALALRAKRPELRVRLLEQAPALAGNHTWSYHETDISPWFHQLLAPARDAAWATHEVRFPTVARTLGGYASLASHKLAEAVAQAGVAVQCGVAVQRLDRAAVQLADGSALSAACVIDARGGAPPGHVVGWQKFVGLELALDAPAPRSTPLLMDATVPQRDGFRFVYVLPFSPTRVLIEDTYYSDTPELDVAALQTGILAYAAQHGYRVREVLRVEQGQLPLVGDGRPQVGEGPFVHGYRGGWLHPTTGYALPVVARVTELLVEALPQVDTPALRALADEVATQARFAGLLNRLMFRATTPALRWEVMARFYGLPDATVARFYGLATTSRDRLRVFWGRPPRGVSLYKAMQEGLR